MSAADAKQRASKGLLWWSLRLPLTNVDCWLECASQISPTINWNKMVTPLQVAQQHPGRRLSSLGASSTCSLCLPRLPCEVFVLWFPCKDSSWPGLIRRVWASLCYILAHSTKPSKETWGQVGDWHKQGLGLSLISSAKCNIVGKDHMVMECFVELILLLLSSRFTEPERRAIFSLVW